MLVAVGLLCCIGSAIAGAVVQPPEIPKPFPCIKGQKCPIPWPRCPLGQVTGRPCRPGYPQCKRGYTCIVGRCCKDRVPAKCPTGSLTGPVCGIRNRCKFGYTCRRGRCCSNQCPRGMAQGPFCNKNQPCKRGYVCRKGVCCRKKIIVPPRRCPLGQMQVPGICISKRGCPKGSSCYKDMCCRRHIILPPNLPSGKCPFGQMRVPGSCISKRGCPKGSSCYKNTCCRRHIIFPPDLGQCPPTPPGMAGICVERCNNCESRGQLCCSNGCGHVCKDPVKPIVPPGKCPFGQMRVPGSCISKRGCPKGSSCYKNTCCRRHIIFPPGLGQCPPLRPGTVGTCVELCNNCESRGQLCCSNGCGHVCKDPVKPIVPPGKCPLGQIRVPGSCISKMGCPKGSSCYKNTCCRRHIIIPPGRDGFCPGGAAPPKFPICPLLRPKLPSLSCTSDKQCRKTEKCCTDYCGRRRCRTALPFPPP